MSPLWLSLTGLAGCALVADDTEPVPVEALDDLEGSWTVSFQEYNDLEAPLERQNTLTVDSEAGTARFVYQEEITYPEDGTQELMEDRECIAEIPRPGHLRLYDCFGTWWYADFGEKLTVRGEDEEWGELNWVPAELLAGMLRLEGLYYEPR